VFDLAFVHDEPEHHEEGWEALQGEIVLGEHRERFLASLDRWARRAYEHHWIDAARRLLDGADRTAFITSAFQFWWPMWRHGDSLVVQEQLLWTDESAHVFDPADPFCAIGERMSVTEDGTRVSEWTLRLADIQDFVNRRSSNYLPA
jgi:hypothetical protein